MIHQLIFASPKPGMTEQEFQRYWIEVHAVKFASKIPQIKRYMIDARVDLPGETKAPLWSGLAEIWLENEKEQLASMQTREFLQGARLDEPNWAAFWNTLVLDTDTHVLIEGPALTKNPTWVKLVILFKRKEGMKLEDFRKYSLGAHADIGRKLPGLRRYIQCHTRDSWYVVGEPRFDSCAMLWFDSPEATQKALSLAEFARAEDDLGNFVEKKYIFRMAVRENWIIGPEARK
ncbi:MAG: EthD family reductase [Candidatus Omnitrophica bacterium]|nr:EthD family reductase [Candidatus Omnitrophota bacterium]